MSLLRLTDGPREPLEQAIAVAPEGLLRITEPPKIQPPQLRVAALGPRPLKASACAERAACPASKEALLTPSTTPPAAKPLVAVVKGKGSVVKPPAVVGRLQDSLHGTDRTFGRTSCTGPSTNATVTTNGATITTTLRRRCAPLYTTGDTGVSSGNNSPTRTNSWTSLHRRAEHGSCTPRWLNSCSPAP